jgi:long-subunit fatty acid transport protein
MHILVRKHLTFTFRLCALLAVLISSARSQTNTENFAQFRFNFNNPGARATGLGGAFISIADDATAAEANPAGLTTLLRPEVSLEGKGIQFTTRVQNFSSTGTDPNFQSVSREFKNSIFSPSFATVVFPFRKFTFSAFRYELVNFESAFFTEGASLLTSQGATHFFPVKSSTKLKVVNWGGSAAYKISNEFSLGVSGGVSAISMNSSLTRYLLAVFNDGVIANSATIDDTGTDFFINVGLIYKPTDKFSVGVVYKQRPSFDLHHSFRIVLNPRDSIENKSIHFRVPSSIGIGLSYRPTDVLTLAFDVVRIQYSSLTKDMVLTISQDAASAADFTVDNGFEVHGGAEYVTFIGTMGLVFRAGAYLEPDNRIRWVGNVNDSSDPDRIFSRELLAALFKKGDSYVHGTFGVGVVISDNFQFDVAGNISSVTKEAVGSLVVRF